MFIKNAEKQLVVSNHSKMRNVFKKVFTLGHCPLNCHTFKFESSIPRLSGSKGTGGAKIKTSLVMKFPLGKCKIYTIEFGRVGEEFSWLCGIKRFHEYRGTKRGFNSNTFFVMHWKPKVPEMSAFQS